MNQATKETMYEYMAQPAEVQERRAERELAFRDALPRIKRLDAYHFRRMRVTKEMEEREQLAASGQLPELRKETVEEFLQRGGKIHKCVNGVAQGAFALTAVYVRCNLAAMSSADGNGVTPTRGGS